MQIDVINFDGKSVGKVELADQIFGINARADILHRVVTWQRAKSRAGTHAVKTVSDVAGSGKKAFKQKKTGNARQGERYNVHMRGGGVVHGPVVRDHAIDLPKKIRALGLKMALSSKAKDGNLIVIDSEKLPAAKTAAFAKQLKKLNLTSALFVGGAQLDENFQKSAANIPNIDALPTIGLNVLDILNHDKLVLTADAVKAVEARLA
ncbi:MAG TPA: 50S ribosomal protein L4 [Candidatus Enterousia intestinigallinarum]|uniref:Large ribosomal subunit protein uL4 n=1 Tax=Candidatus Enterousia intestinigallinarum TaxID=2840790 RepID=A0A9D1FFD3_9PROT|nr:50S ribosomal protein L4 [Candidatus Enterousia intestinigallinarum]